MQNSKPLTKNKSAIMNAYLALLQSKEDEQITIEQIAEATGMHRRTFYRYFHTKQEVLTYYLTYLFRQYIDDMHVEEGITFEKITYTFFAFSHQNCGILEIIVQNNMEVYLLELFNSFSILLEPLCKQEETEENQYAVSYRIGGFWNVMLKWLKNGRKETPEEMVENLSGITFNN